MNDKLEAQAKSLEEIARELEKAVAHAKTAGIFPINGGSVC